ncbi:MAG: hypothetical protein HKP55_03555 [Gammaproteobacteria bacterium]|nr:hypothetical protein [Gammaproteobacteria bacterium]
MAKQTLLISDIKRLEEHHSALNGLWGCFARIKAKSGARPKQATVEEMFRRHLNARDVIYDLFREAIDKYNFQIPVVDM